jgi:hypothetical protein
MLVVLNVPNAMRVKQEQEIMVFVSHAQEVNIEVVA